MPDSLIELKRDEILEISQKLSRIHILLTLKLFEEFEEFKAKRRGLDDHHDIDINSFKNRDLERKGSNAIKNDPNKGFMLSLNANPVNINFIQSNFLSKI